MILVLLFRLKLVMVRSQKSTKISTASVQKICQQKSEDKNSFTIDSLDVGLNTFK